MSADPSKLHPEEAKLYGSLIIVFGAVLIFLGVLIVSTADYGSLRAAASPLAMLWAGVVIVASGRTVQTTAVLIRSPALFLVGFLLGVSSLIAMLGAISTGATATTVLAFAAQVVAIFFVWRAVAPTAARH